MSCPHGIYNAYGCQQCRPELTDGPVPVLPRSSSDPLADTKTDKHETCGGCGNLRTHFDTKCRFCGKPFPVDDSRRVQGAANAHSAGTCPHCGSAIHYETKKVSKWQCAECDAIYDAPRRKA